MASKEANRRYKIALFYEKFGLEAFEISKRIFYRYKSLLKKGNNKIEALESKSKAPWQPRKSAVPREIIAEIKRLREKYPNLGKTKLYHILKPWCIENELPVILESTIGRIIAKDKDKMRITPLRIEHYGRVKPKKESSKTSESKLCIFRQ